MADLSKPAPCAPLTSLISLTATVSPVALTRAFHTSPNAPLPTVLISSYLSPGAPPAPVPPALIVRTHQGRQSRLPSPPRAHASPGTAGAPGAAGLVSSRGATSCAVVDRVWSSWCLGASSSGRGGTGAAGPRCVCGCACCC